MSALELQAGVTYGPINSRRLGRSLGINLLPAERKLCTFDCVYCQYGSARPVSVRARGFPTVETVMEGVEKALRLQSSPPDYLTFSGNGEPTLHPRFAEIVREVCRLRDRACPETMVAVLSNSSRVNDPEVRRAIAALDDPIMKLDAGDPVTLAKINRPAEGISFEEIMEGLAGLPGLIIQSMIISGRVQNARGDAHERWLAAIAELSPEEVQIYSSERPVAETGVQQVSKDELDDLAARAEQRIGVPIRAY
jgi:wyosine [tRNA(Phe)-imidazoG37] synthetase (radical SAM superfamily)